MEISLYDLSVANYLQTLGAVSGFLNKGLTHCRDNNIGPEEIVDTRIFPDMLPFRFQIQSLTRHSIGAMESIKSGVFYPRSDWPALNYTALQALIADTRDALQKLTLEEVNSREGADVIFQVPDTKLLFTAKDFLMSFSLPSFYFHAATAYDILRSKGVPVGKRDYLGTMRLKT